MESRRIFVDEINVGHRLRGLDQKKVDAIAESIRVVGMLHPICLYDATGKGDYLLSSGAHRLAAIQKLGWEFVDVNLIIGDELKAKLAEIDENLCRSNLTPTEEAEHVAERKKVWGTMQNLISDQLDPKLKTETNPKGAGRTMEFASSTAALTGSTKAHINRAVRRAEKVSDATRDLIRGTSLDTGVFLDKVAKADMSDEEQVEFVKGELKARADTEKSGALARGNRDRAAVTAETRKTSLTECCELLFTALDERQWTLLVELVEHAGGALKAGDLRAWAVSHPYGKADPMATDKAGDTASEHAVHDAID